MIQDEAEIIRHEARWCQGALARAGRGQPTTISRGKAFDAIGAVYKATHTRVDDYDFPHEVGAALAGMQLAAITLHGCSVERVNDTLGHGAVMDVMRLAWRQASSEPPKGR